MFLCPFIICISQNFISDFSCLFIIRKVCVNFAHCGAVDNTEYQGDGSYDKL